MTLPDELEIRCPKCGGLLTAYVGPPNRDLSGAVRWDCPYCRASHTDAFGGVLHWIVKRTPDRTAVH